MDSQYKFFDKIDLKAEYSDDKYSEVDKMVVFDEKSIWLENATGFYAQIVEALPISVYVKDEHSNFTYMNAKARQMLNFQEQEVVGIKDALVLKDKKAAELFSKLDDQVRSEKKKHSITEEWRSEKGEDVVNVTTRYPIVKIVDGKEIIVGVTAIADDLAWRQKALVGREIIHMITHDWVTALLKDFDVGIKYSTDSEIKERSEIFNFVMEYLENLSIYYEADVNSEKFSRRLKVCDLKSIVFKPMCNLMSYYNKMDKYWTIPVIEAPEVLLEVNCNPIFLKILVYQQIRNHLSYGFSKTKLKIQAKRVKKSDHYFILFKSPGTEIPPDIVEKFDSPYYGYESSKSENNDTHLQLGLFVCRKIAGLHDGKCTYYYNAKLKMNCFKYELKNLPKPF